MNATFKDLIIAILLIIATCLLLVRHKDPVNPITSTEIKDPIVPGDIWVFYEDKRKEGDPFPPPESRENESTVRIIDYKDGWVRYYLGRFYPDERMKESYFRHSYRKKKDQNEK